MYFIPCPLFSQGTDLECLSQQQKLIYLCVSKKTKTSNSIPSLFLLYYLREITVSMNNEYSSMFSISDPELLSVQYPVVSVVLCRAFHCKSIATRGRL